MSGLDAYRKKRDFKATPEPAPEARKRRAKPGDRRFVVQMHDARRLHYDFRLEHEGVLLSWAVPKGPSLDPKQRRLAVHTEDHTLSYADFEGTIPAGQYGAGPVLVWDRGIWIPEGDPASDYERGRMKFALEGEKLHGRWHLVRTKDDKTWLLIKSRDEFARSDGDAEIVEVLPRSVISGRSIDEIARGDCPGPPQDPPEPLAEPSAERVAERLGEWGKPAAPPAVLTPQLAVAVERVPEGSNWLHEIKLDGYRILAHIREGQVRLRTRGREDWTERLPTLARELADPILADSVLDGELCALDSGGEPRFELLQQALAEGRDQSLVLYLFDLPFAGGRDLRRIPLIERKRILRGLLDELGSQRSIRFCDHVVGSGPEVFARACELGVEGIVSKRISSTYEGRRSHAWRKRKCARRIRVVVGGFTAPQGSRRYFGALLVGTHEDGQFRYRGKVGSGYDESTLAQLHAKLERIRQDRPAFVDPPTAIEARGVTWVAPEVLIEVEYSELTEVGRIRHGRFKALLESQPEPKSMPKSKSKPSASATHPPAVRLTHPDKLLYAERGYSKRDVADYIMQVAEWMLPHVRDRPLTLVRCPEGVEGDCFYQKHAMPGLPASVGRVSVRESNGDEILYATVTDALGLVGLVQMSVIELHIWGSRVADLEHPDMLVFDLDPDEGLEFARVIEAAVELRDRLAELKLESFVKTTGGKGLHVVLPVAPRHDFTQIKPFCRAFAMTMAKDAPDRYTAVMSKAERRGKIFIDYLRNGRGATSVAPYSLRARADALVSTPLRWDELSAALSPESFDLSTVPARLASLDHDPWDRFFALRQSVSKAALRAVGIEG